MKQLTIRGFDEELERHLRKLARTEGISLNQAALRLMRGGAGMVDGKGQEDIVGSSLDSLAGTWTEEEEFLSSIDLCEEIDEALWK